MLKKAICASLAVLIALFALCGCAAFSKSGDIDAVSKSVLQKADDRIAIEGKAAEAFKTPVPSADEPAGSDKPADTKEPEQSAEPAATQSPASNALMYTSSRFGFTIEFPKSWEGKYRIWEFEGGISVFFVPSASIEDGKGKFFTLMVNPEEDEQDFFDNSKWIHTKKADYLYGGPTDVTYMESDPEYDTFVRMNKEVDAIMGTLRD